METEVVGTFFNEQQELYEMVVRENYLFHRELFAALRTYLQNRFTESFSVLDLGCGDARFSAVALQGLPVASYTGLDLAPASLEKARENLKRLGCPLDLRQANLLDVPAQEFDLVMSSYAVHHLSREEKRRWFAALRLKPRGVVTMIDAVLQPDETRPQYLERFMAWTERGWTALQPIHRQLLREHVMNYDFPESEETWREISGKPLTVLWKDPVPVAEVIVFQ